MTNILLGISGLTNALINDWIGPAMIIIIAAVSLKFLISRQF